MKSKRSETVATLYHPDKRTIGELLSTTNPPLVVPNWQRSYSWTASHVETFWNDLMEFNRSHPGNSVDQREYFLGSIVIVATSSREHLLLDGQQRLATSTILLSVIREFLKRFKDDAAKRLQNKYLADYDDAKDELVYKLALNAYDREYFRRKVLEYRDASYKEPTPEYASHYLIDGARDYFEQIFEGAYKELAPEDAYRWALRIQDVLLNHFSLVAVTSSDEDSAAEVFETLNDRGIGLSTPDLLRNLVIRRAPEQLREDIVELWGEIIEFETDAEIKGFLRHYWISHHGDVKTQRLYREIKGHIVENDIQSIEFSRELKDASVVYRDIVAARDNNADLEEYLRAVAELGASVLYPVILSTMESVPDVYEKDDLLEALVSLYVRHSVIVQLENSKLENVIHKVANDLRKGLKVSDALAALAELSPSNEAFESAFARVSISRSATQRYLLRELEMDQRRTEELNVNPPHKVHVEHIYPQSPEGPFKLPNHNQVINRIGNLTLLDKTLNIKARNGRFTDKKPHYKTSEIQITSSLCAIDSEDWTPDLIEARQDEFARRATSIWRIVTP